MTVEEIGVLEITAKSVSHVSSEQVLKLVAAYRRMEESADIWARVAWNNGVLSTREQICARLMPKYGSQLGHEVWDTEIPDPYPPLKRRGEQ